MTQIIAITRNTLLQTIRQPVYGIIVFVTLAGIALTPSLTAWTLDDDNKLLRDIGLSTLLIQGLFLAAFGASSVLHTEIEDRTVLTVASKPVGRGTFLLGKYFGVLGALALGHYLAGLAFYMTMRHGVLQTAAETSDPTVLLFGPGLMLLMVFAAATLNYLWEWRFLPTLIKLSVPALTIGTVILLFINRDWKIEAYESVQPIERLPAECQDPASFQGIITFRPGEGQSHLAGHSGMLVHNDWKGPISIEDQNRLRELRDTPKWRQDVDLLVDKTRKRQGPEIFKSAVLLFIAVAMLGAVALAASTRLGVMGTFVTSLLALVVGLSADQVLRPLTLAEDARIWAVIAYRVLPNFQAFWMVDALSENLIIPWDYIASAAGYGFLYIAALLLLGMGLFETREVG
jgi:hypothetical protein